MGDRMKTSFTGATVLAAALLLVMLPEVQALDWDFSKAEIPVGEIRSGGPPRDGIPALFAPATIPAAEADFLEEGDRVLGLEVGGDARAYPLRILSWHELVNDTVGGRPVLVSW